jgi:hypothetical protein
MAPARSGGAIEEDPPSLVGNPEVMARSSFIRLLPNCL